MTNKKFLLMLLLLLLYNFLPAQNDFTFSNDSVKWSLLKTSMELISKDTLRSPKYFIRISDNGKMIDSLNKMNNSTIISLLEDEKSDWCINLILYSIYNKDADLFFAFNIRSRDDWANNNYFRDIDIKYWTEFLKSKQ